MSAAPEPLPEPAGLGVDAATGALLGAALGDALGAPFEGRPRVDRDEIERLIGSTRALRWTDDTHMMLTLGQSLVDHGGLVEPEDLGDAFAAAFLEEPWRGYGPGPPQVFERAARGDTYLAAAAALYGGTGSFGNGGAMRCAPAAVVGVHDPAGVASLAAAQAAVTHAHPEGRAGAVLLAGVIRLALVTPPGLPLDPGRVDLGPDGLASEVFEAALARLARPQRTRRDLLRLADRFGTSVDARESVPAAIAVALAARGDTIAAITAAVELGGDTDTVACMAGAIAGAHTGASGLPAGLLDRLEDRDRIARLAADLLALAEERA